MVYATAGILLAAFGLAALVAPRIVLKWENRRQRRRDADLSERRIRIVRISGLAFLAVGLVFYYVDAGSPL